MRKYDRAEILSNEDQYRVDKELEKDNPNLSFLSSQVASIKEEEIRNINPIDDHNPKYNKSIDDANKRMLEQLSKDNSQLNHLEEDVIITEDGRKIHTRNSDDYKKIWRAFLETETDDFKRMMGYGKKTIKRIGIKKFIDAMDWRNEDDVCKYKTDSYKVIVCPNCNLEFGIFQENIGLCNKCVPLFNMDNFWGSYGVLIDKNPEEASAMIGTFLAHKEFRDMYKRKTLPELFDLCREEKFEGIETYKYITDMLHRVLQEKGIGEDSYQLFINRFDLNLTDRVSGSEYEKNVLNIRDKIILEFTEKWANTIIYNLRDILLIKEEDI